MKKKLNLHEMIMKRFTLLSILFLTVLFIGCDTTEPYLSSMSNIPKEINGSLKTIKNVLPKNGEKQLSIEFTSNDGKYVLRIQSLQENGHLQSKLIYKEKDDPWKELSFIDIDLTSKNYKQQMNSLVERQANQLRAKYKISKLQKPALILSKIPEKLFNKLSREEYYNELAQAALYHWGILKSAQRAEESKSADCHCGKLDTYITGESPFFCSEDIMLRADKIYDVIYQLSQERRFSGKRFIPKQTFEFLRGKRGEVVSASTVDRIFKKEFHHFWNKTLTKRDRNLVLKEAGPRSSNQLPLDPECFLYNVRSGRDCGCCDNYPGPCILDLLFA